MKLEHKCDLACAAIESAYFCNSTKKPIKRPTGDLTGFICYERFGGWTDAQVLQAMYDMGLAERVDEKYSLCFRPSEQQIQHNIQLCEINKREWSK